MAYGSALVDNIQSSTANTPVVFKDGNGTQIGTLCRAWLDYDGTSGTILGSFNITSVTKNSTGYYSVFFTNDMPDANYAANVISNSSTGGFTTTPFIGVGSKGTHSFAVYEFSNSGTSVDTVIGVSIFR